MEPEQPVFNPVLDQSFTEGTVDLDGISFQGCSFSGVTLQFSGRKGFEFRGCEFYDVVFSFSGAAERAITSLGYLWATGFDSLPDTFLGMAKARFSEVRGATEAMRLETDELDEIGSGDSAP